MGVKKFYLLYNDDNQSKLLTTAASEEKKLFETEYYSDGVWFEYDQNDGSNFLFNEKKLKGSKFPSEPKIREVKEFGPDNKTTFKWVG